MSRSIGFSVAGLAVLATVGLTGASGHSELGEYKTRVSGDRLFINGGRILRCDLFFSTPGAPTVVAPKGAQLNQSVPPVVWQYSGLLPVSDYLRTVAIHSVASNDKTRPWQDVQKTFYDGLLVEGANHTDAKIAFAGAYSFAPRWPLVEFVEVKEEKVIYPDTVLYSVEYIQPNSKGMTLEAYRNLALQILQQPENVTLADIQGVIDAADVSRSKAEDRASLGGIGGTSDSMSDVQALGKKMDAAVPVARPNKPQKPTGSIIIGNNGTLMDSAENMVVSINGIEKAPEKEAGTDTPDSKAKVMPEDVDSPILTPGSTSDDKAMVEKPMADEAAQSMANKAPDMSNKNLPVSELFIDDMKSDMKEGTSPAMNGEAGVAGVEGKEMMQEAGQLAALSTDELMTLSGPQDDWVLLPDGTMVLRNISKLVEQ